MPPERRRWPGRAACGMVRGILEVALTVTLADIEAARRVIAGAVLRTPMLPAPKLSALTGAEVFVKYENLQVTNSFKDRGALVKLSSLTPEERGRGVIAMSAGNHAQAVAYHAARLGIPATIVMPVTTPFVKVQATRSYGAEVVLDGETVAEAQARCERLRAEHGYTLVHPYDDPHVIAGQGTIALEMLEEVPDARRAGGPDRRRRPDRRLRHRRQGHQGRRSKSSARKPRFIRRCGTRCITNGGRSAARRWPKASR